ncbi:hypothetical protein [Streptomyces sp. NBC_01294]|uniref:hypothetical protein n=1 Tax=Streptomyces sp. NBC_01294 TaxID=2903815 RepID=UPI002DD8A043|nr:hypothetical protein [Streptomyces sp. NBC_01294]WRZ55158.1 hypothetical protein OG534_00705 [Streptomyces sp. NBC_01294]
MSPVNPHLAPVAVPDPALLPHVQQLCDLTDPYASGPEQDELFAAAMAETNAWHTERSPFFRSLYEATPPAEPYRTPLVSTANCSRHEVLSIPREDVELHLTSSGTTGQKSQMFFDHWTIRSAQRMVARIFERNGWITPDQEVNHFWAPSEPPLPEPRHRSPPTTTARSPRPGAASRTRCATPVASTSSTPSAASPRCAASSRRTRRSASWASPPSSSSPWSGCGPWACRCARPEVALMSSAAAGRGTPTGASARRSCTRASPSSSASRVSGSGTPSGRSSTASRTSSATTTGCTLPSGRGWRIRSTRTLETPPYGERGRPRLVSPYITSVPAQSVVMGDLASLQPGDACGCGAADPGSPSTAAAGVSRCNRSCSGGLQRN